MIQRLQKRYACAKTAAAGVPQYVLMVHFFPFRNGTKIYGGKKITARIFFIDIAFLSTISIGVQYLTFAPYHFVSAGTGTALNATNVAWAYLLSVLMLGVDIMPVKVLLMDFYLWSDSLR